MKWALLMLYKIRSEEKGQSLIELLVAMGVFVLVVSSIMFLALDAHSANRQGSERSRAAWLAQSSIEAAESIKNRGWKYLAIGDHGVQTAGGQWEFNGSSDSIDQFIRQITVDSVSRGINGEMVATGGQVDFDTKKITANVAWDFSPSRPSEVVIESFLMNWGSYKWIQTSQNDFNGGALNNTVVTGEGGGAVELMQGVAQYWGNQFLVESLDAVGNLDKDVKKTAMRFTDQLSGRVNEVRIYVNELQGNSPMYRCGLQLDAGGLPSGTWLGNSGTGYGDLRPATTGWITVSLQETVDLTADQIYHLVIERESGLINNRNYISVRSSEPQNYMVPFDNSDDQYSTVLWNNKSRWITTTFNPIYVLNYTDRSAEGNPYSDSVEEPVYGNLFVGQEFIIQGGNREVSGISFYTRKNTNSDPRDDLYVTLYNVSSGIQINRGVLASAASISQNYEWRSYAFPATITLQDNTVYRVFLSSPGTDNRFYYQVYNISHTDDSVLDSINFQGEDSNYTNSIDGGSSWGVQNNGDIGGYRFSLSTGYALTGDLISSSFNTSSGNTVFNYINFSSLEPAGTSLAFQLRTANNQNDLSSAIWVGPDGTPATDYSAPGQVITNDPGALVQYKAYFTSDGNSTPKLFDITIDYEP